MTFPVLMAIALQPSFSVTLSVDPSQVIRRDLDSLFGINLNFKKDLDSDRPAARPLREALSEMGVRWLRFPGGEKSDFHRWSVPPYEGPTPQALRWYSDLGGGMMTVDQAGALARQTGSQLHFVLAYDSFERTGRREEEMREDASAWVRYAKRKGWKNIWWEVGNENWHNSTATPEEMAAVVGRFAKDLRAIDPAIRLGASGRRGWWDKFLPAAAAHLDFVTVSQYNGWEWRSYERFLGEPEPDLVEEARGAQEAIDRLPLAEDRNRLKVVVAETNTKDYSEGGWPDRNDIGHALPTFVSLGRLAELPKVAGAMIWTTRWMEDKDPTQSMWHAFDHGNRPTATGWALQMWGKFVEPLLVRASSSDRRVIVFASCSMSREKGVLWAVNRSGEAAEATLGAVGGSSARVTSWERVSGSDPLDVTLDHSSGQGQKLPVLLPPYSITAFRLAW